MSNVLRLLKTEHNNDALIANFILGRPETTQRVYRNELNCFLSFVDRHALTVCARDLRAYLEQARKSALERSTVRHKVAVIKSFYAFLVQEGDLDKDPMARVATPPNPESEASRCISTAQVTAFFEKIPQHRMVGIRDRAIFLLAASCGLRLSELSRLSVADITDGPEKGWRTIRVRGKGEKVRDVHVRPEIWAYILAYLQRRGPLLSQDSPLFASVFRIKCIRPQLADLRIPSATIYKRFKKIVRSAGLPTWASPHTLRHYFASEAHQNGCPAETLRKALGHSSLKTTQRYLDRVTPGINEAFAKVKIIRTNS